MQSVENGATGIPGSNTAPGWNRAIAVPAVIGTSIAIQLVLGSGQLTGPSWRQAVNTAAHQCGDGRPAALIQHNPPGWFFGLACTTLDATH